jgi:uncharacterized membrane protein
LKHITATFLRGLVTILPIILTVYILWWLATAGEALLGRPLKAILPAGVYHPGVGFAAGVVLVFATGLVMELYVARRLWAGLERVVLRIPVVKAVYGALRDFAGFISESSRAGAMGQVVRVTIAPRVHVLGFVTRQEFGGLPSGVAAADTVAVYLPMSYQIGGYTVFLPRSMIEPIEMSVQEALRFTLTAGMSHRGE